MVHGGGYCHIGTKSNDNEFITDECFGGHLGGNYPPFFIILFLSVGLVAPHPIPGYLLYLFVMLPFLLSLVSLSPSDLVFKGESDPKSGMAET